jgi:hypothetical protein
MAASGCQLWHPNPTSGERTGLLRERKHEDRSKPAGEKTELKAGAEITATRRSLLTWSPSRSNQC